MKTYYKVTGKTCHTIHTELRKIGDLINPIPIKKLLIKSISERIKNNR